MAEMIKIFHNKMNKVMFPLRQQHKQGIAYTGMPTYMHEENGYTPSSDGSKSGSSGNNAITVAIDDSKKENAPTPTDCTEWHSPPVINNSTPIVHQQEYVEEVNPSETHVFVLSTDNLTDLSQSTSKFFPRENGNIHAESDASSENANHPGSAVSTIKTIMSATADDGRNDQYVSQQDESNVSSLSAAQQNIHSMLTSVHEENGCTPSSDGSKLGSSSGNSIAVASDDLKKKNVHTMLASSDPYQLNPEIDCTERYSPLVINNDTRRMDHQQEEVEDIYHALHSHNSAEEVAHTNIDDQNGAEEAQVDRSGDSIIGVLILSTDNLTDLSQSKSKFSPRENRNMHAESDASSENANHPGSVAATIPSIMYAPTKVL
eukprot:scaffold42935_cov65-Attheya_sp.AAC.2